MLKADFFFFARCVSVHASIVHIFFFFFLAAYGRFSCHGALTFAGIWLWAIKRQVGAFHMDPTTAEWSSGMRLIKVSPLWDMCPAATHSKMKKSKAMSAQKKRPFHLNAELLTTMSMLEDCLSHSLLQVKTEYLEYIWGIMAAGSPID